MKREATRSIGAVIADYVQESNLEDGLLQARVCAAWDSIIIGQIALRDYTSRRTFRDGVLTCKIRSSVVRSQLSFQRDALLAKVNALLAQDDMFTRGEGEKDIVKELILK